MSGATIASMHHMETLAMDIRSILVNVDLDAANSTALDYAIDLSAKFGADLIGVAAEEPNFAYLGVDAGATALDVYSLERTDIEKRLDAAESAFKAKVPAGMVAHWHAYVSNSVRALIEQATAADLIVTAAKASSTFGGQQVVDLGELVLASGRPVIDVAAAAGKAKFDTIVIGWKNTREARRAVADALPLLKLGKAVTAITVSEGDREDEYRRLEELVAWLGRHGVTAKSELLPNEDGFIDVLESTARAMKADLVVAGGYGHSRMREWLFGGITRNLLAANTLNRLFSN